MTKRHVELILPVYNEVANIQPLLKELDSTSVTLQEMVSISYLFVNDGSNDGTKELLHRIHKDREDVRVVDLIHNFGHSSAIACGLDNFRGDAAIIMDADGQDSSDALIELIQRWLAGAKTVVVERGSRKETARIIFKVFYALLHKISPSLPQLDYGTHCLIEKTVVERIQKLKERNRYFPGLVSFSSSTIHSIQANRRRRRSGHSRVGTLGLVQLAITAFVGFSNAPVRFVSLVGLVCSFIALMGGGVIVSIKIFTPLAIPGWASLMTAMFFGSGIQLLCLGIIGEYIARIYDEVKERPLYIVDKFLDKSLKSKERVA